MRLTSTSEENEKCAIESPTSDTVLQRLTYFYSILRRIVHAKIDIKIVTLKSGHMQTNARYRSYTIRIYNGNFAEQRTRIGAKVTRARPHARIPSNTHTHTHTHIHIHTHTYTYIRIIRLNTTIAIGDMKRCISPQNNDHFVNVAPKIIFNA